MHACAGPWLALEREDAVAGGDAVGEAAQARAGRGVRAADPVILDVDDQAIADRRDARGRLRSLRLLGHPAVVEASTVRSEPDSAEL